MLAASVAPGTPSDLNLFSEAEESPGAVAPPSLTLRIQISSARSLLQQKPGLPEGFAWEESVVQQLELGAYE